MFKSLASYFFPPKENQLFPRSRKLLPVEVSTLLWDWARKASDLRSLSGDVLVLTVAFCKQSGALVFSEMGTWKNITTKIHLLNSPLHLLLVQEDNTQLQLFPLCLCNKKARQLASLCFLNQLRACPQLSCKSDCVRTPTTYSQPLNPAYQRLEEIHHKWVTAASPKRKVGLNNRFQVIFKYGSDKVN